MPPSAPLHTQPAVPSLSPSPALLPPLPYPLPVDWRACLRPAALQPLVPSASEPAYLDGDGVDVFATLSSGTAVRDELL